CLIRCCSTACTNDPTCGATSCDMAGACLYPTIICSAMCTTGDTRSVTTKCKGGTCSDVNPTVNCDPGLKCQGGLCPGTCAGDGDCLPDYTCTSGGTCKKRAGKSC